MKFIHNLTLITIILIATNIFAQSPTLADAQRAYVAGNWKEAAIAYEQVCDTVADTTKTECYFWNILALSQTGSAEDFKRAGRRLDLLIKETNPQNRVYSDLLMTHAQFQMYLGKYENAGNDLVSAIETSGPQQKIALQKVCEAIRPKAKSETLDSACVRLSSNEANTPSKNGDTSAPAVAVPAQGAWILQLGAFSVKSNAELLTTNLINKGFPCQMEERIGEEKTLYIVFIPGFSTKEEAIEFGTQKLTPISVNFQPILKK